MWVWWQEVWKEAVNTLCGVWAVGVRVTVLIDQDYLVVVLLEFYFLARAGTQQLLAEVISTVA